MSKPITLEKMKAYVDATWKKCQSEAWAEPVAWIYQNTHTEKEYLVWTKGTGGRNWRPLYTAPPQRKPLTEKEILTYRHMIDWTAEWSYINFARAIEAAHGIKGDA